MTQTNKPHKKDNHHAKWHDGVQGRTSTTQHTNIDNNIPIPTYEYDRPCSEYLVPCRYTEPTPTPLFSVLLCCITIHLQFLGHQMAALSLMNGWGQGLLIPNCIVTAMMGATRMVTAAIARFDGPRAPSLYASSPSSSTSLSTSTTGLPSQSVPQARIAQRHLYDFDFLDAGCDTSIIPFDETTNVDNLQWTYATNYAVATTSLLFALLLWQLHRRQRHSGPTPPPPPSAKPSPRPFMAAVFFFMAFTFATAGVGHQVITSTEDDLEILFQVMTVGSSVVYSSILAIVMISITFPSRTDPQNYDMTTKAIAAWTVALLVAMGAIPSLIMLGVVFNGAVSLWALVVYASQALRLRKYAEIMHLDAVSTEESLAPSTSVSVPEIPEHLEAANQGNAEQHGDTPTLLPQAQQQHRVGVEPVRRILILKSLALSVMLIGGVIQGALSATCGAGGYEDCFRDCPLPTDPMIINHNAWFHMLFNAGVIMWGVAELLIPSQGSCTILIEATHN